MFELDDLSGPVRQTVVDLEARWRGVLAGFVQGAVAVGHLPEALDCEQVVWEMTGIYLAHHAALRLARAPDADDRAQAAFSRLIAWAATGKSSQQVQANQGERQ